MRVEIEAATGAGVRVALVDSGVERGHVVANVRPGIAIVPDAGGAMLRAERSEGDGLGHGTMCAGIIAAVAPGAIIHPVRVFGATRETSADIVAAALDWICHTGADVVNLSLGTTKDEAYPLVREACRRLQSKGSILVAADAAGRAAPACLSDVIAVRAGGLHAGLRVWPVRQRDQDFIAVTGRYGTWAPGASASFAVAVVSGLVARVLELEPAAGPERIRQMLAGPNGRSLDAARLIRRRSAPAAVLQDRGTHG
jgi:subtilisin